MANEESLDLIDRGSLTKEISKIGVVSLGTVLGCLSSAPTVDAVEVVHGRWDTIWQGEDSRGNVVKCSVCGYKKFDTTDHYCPNCGAKMDAKE